MLFRELSVSGGGPPEADQKDTPANREENGHGCMGVARAKVKTGYRSSPPFPGKLLAPKNAFYVATVRLPPVTGRWENQQ